MKKLKLIRELFLAYVILIIIFNIIILPSVSFPRLQIIFSFLWIALILIPIFNFSCERSLVWWTLIIVSGLGIIRPLIEFIYSLFFPAIITTLFPPFTPFFSTLGVLIMVPAFILLLDPKVKKIFSKN